MTKLTREDIYKTAKELSNWGRWGDDDEIGTLNNISATDIVAAAGLVKQGKVFALGLDLKEKIQSGLFGGRWNLIHQMLATGTDAVNGEQDGDGPGQAGGDEGQHVLEVDVTLEELAQILGDELELPRIEPKGKA